MAMMHMRDRAQGRGGKFIAGAIILVMALFGFGAFTSFVDSDPAMAEVNGDAVTRSQVVREAQRRKARILAQMGEGADPSLINDALLQNSVLEQLIDRQLVLQFATDIGLAASTGRVDKVITDIPNFQVDGVFDKKIYRTLIANDGHSPVSFRAALEESLVLGDLQAGVNDTRQVMDWELRRISNLLSQTRDLAFLVLSPELFSKDIDISDAAIGDYFDLNGADFQTREMIDLSYIELSVSKLMQDDEVSVLAEDIQARYDEDKADFVPTESRHAAHILLEVGDNRSEDEAIQLINETLTRIEAGEDFAELAKALSEDPGSSPKGGDLGYVAENQMVPEFEEALWTLNIDELSVPVVSDFGVHLIKLLDVRVDAYPAFEEQKESIEASMRREQAEALFAERMQLIDDLAFQEPDSLDAVGKQFGLKIERVAAVTAGASEGLFANPILQEAAFSSEVSDDGFNSKAIQLEDVAYWIHADQHYPAKAKELAAVKEEIHSMLIAEASSDKVDVAVEDILELLNAGEGSSTIASKYGIEWTQVSAAKRNQVNVPRSVSSLAFELPKPEAAKKSNASVALPDGSVAVVTVTAVNDGDIATLTDKDRTDIRMQMERSAGQDDFQALFQSLKTSASIDRS